MGGDYELCLFFPSDKVQIFFELLDLAVNLKARATACESSYGEQTSRKVQLMRVSRAMVEQTSRKVQSIFQNITWALKLLVR